jgi:hypothetical protein
MSLVKPAARIFSPPRNAMQSGPGKIGDWVLEFAPNTRPVVDPLMGWTGGLSTQRQVRLSFPSQEAAVAYAKAEGLHYVVELPPVRRPIKPKSYSDNFRNDRRENWTH